MTSTLHRKISASLWVLLSSAAAVAGFLAPLRPSPKPIPPDVTALQIYSVPTLCGLAAIAGFFFALGYRWASLTTRVFTTVFSIFTGFIFIKGLPELRHYYDFTAGVVDASIVMGAFVIGLYACIVSWRAPSDSNEVN